MIKRIALKFYSYLKKDFLLLVKRKKYLYLSILLPIIIATIFLFMLNPTEEGIDVEACDYDDTEYSREKISELEGFKVRFLPKEECREKLISRIKLGKIPSSKRYTT